jgi:ankyrin repeat protein/predicted DNA-binding WGR domain protein
MVVSRRSASSVTLKSSQNPAQKLETGKGLIVKLPDEVIFCYISEETIKPRSHSILVKKLIETSTKAKYEIEEEIKINPKNIISRITVTQKGKFFIISKANYKILEDLIKQPDEESSEEEEKPIKRKNKSNPSAPTKKTKLEVYKKGETNPKVAILAYTKDMMDPSATCNFSVSIFVNNKNVHRAVYTNNKQLFKNLLKSNQKISSLYGYWSPDCRKTPLELAIETNNEYFIREILKETKNEKLKKAYNPQSGLKSIGTGFVSKQAYGVTVRRVNMSRGGREGNNAFIFQEVAHESISSVNFSEIIQKCTPDTINLLCTLAPDFEFTLGGIVGHAVRSGSLEISKHLLQIANKRGGFGFNFLHEEVLKKGNLTPFKKVSVTKKPIENFFIAPLHVACINPDPKHLESLISMCDDLGYPDIEGRRAVHYAAACTSSKPLELLIRHGANVNEMDKKKITPIMVAARYNRTETLKLLISKGVSCKIKSREGKSAIHYACEHGSYDALKLLIPESDINQPGGERKTPLIYCAMKGHYRCMELLLEHKAKVLCKDKFKRSALILAVKNGHSKEASLLLSKGAPFDHPDSSNNYPIHYAAAYGWVECIDLLVKAGANINAVNDWKIPPLLIAMLKEQIGCVERLLKEHSIDINCKDEQGRTLLSQTIEVLSLDTLRQIEYFLFEKKADPDIPDLNGWTPLHYLCNKSPPNCQNTLLSYSERVKWNQEASDWRQKALEFLLKAKCNINAKNQDGFTPIMLALQKKNTKIAIILIQSGVDLTMTTEKGGIFHFIPSFDTEFNEIIKIILKNTDSSNAGLNCLDDKGYTPFLNYIKYYNNSSCIRLNLKKRLKTEEIRKINENRKVKKIKLIEFNENDTGEVDDDIEYSNEEASDKDTPINNESSENSVEEEDHESDENDEENQENQDDQESDEENQEKEESNEESDDSESEIQEVPKKTQKNKSPGKKSMDIDTEIINNADLQFKKSEFKTFFKTEWSKREQDYQLIINLLVEKGANPHTQVEKLLKYRSNPDLAKTEETPTNQNFITDLNGIKIYKEYNSDGLKSALHLLSKSASPEMLSLLISYKIDINHQDFYGNTPLSKFLQHQKSCNLIKILLENNADPNICNYQKDFPIHITVNSDDLDVTRVLSEFKAELNVVNQTGSTPLMLAAHKRSHKMVRLLCELGADVNFAGGKNKTPLHIAFNYAEVSSNASFNIESILLINGANINAVDSSNRSPLHYTFVKMKFKNDVSHIDPIETVSSACSRKDIDVNIQDKYLRTPLHYAARRGALTSTMFLLSKGALIDIQDCDNNTPLGLAIIGNHSNYVSMLIQRSPNIKKDLYHIEPKDKNIKRHNTALNYQKYSYFRACVRLNWQGAAYLLLFGGYPYSLAIQDALNEEKFDLVQTLFAKVDDASIFHNCNEDRQNLFHTLAIKGKKASDEVIESICYQLFDYKVNFQAADKFGRTPLHYAAQLSCIKLCGILLEKGADINVQDSNGLTPIVKAVEGDLIKNSLGVLELFKAHGADFNVKVPCKDYDSTIFLHALSKECSRKLVKFLISTGCNVYEVDSLGRNALMHLVINNDLKSLKKYATLYNFNINHQDFSGKTLVHYAINPLSFGSYENTQILTYLIKIGADATIKDNQNMSPYYYASLQFSGKMVKVLESHKIKEKVTVERKYSGYEDTIIELDFEKDAEDYQNSLNDIKHIEDIGLAPDPYGQFDKSYKVLNDFDVLMNKVDLSYGLYSAYVFYKMQLLHDTNRDVYVLFTRWGRIGEVGAYQRTPFSTREEAEKNFKSLYRNKTGNDWGKNFKRVKNKYCVMALEKSRLIAKDYITDISYENCPKSNLDEKLEEVIKGISKSTIYRESMSRYRLDVEVLNFSCISKQALEDAENILLELANLINLLGKSKSVDNSLNIKEKIFDLNSRYFELIPHTANNNARMIPIQRPNVLSNEISMLSELKNIETSSKIILGALKNQHNINPAEYIYNCLQTSIEIIQSASPEHDLISKYYYNGEDSFKISNIFRLKRKGEKERISKYNHIKNRKLLWHGTSDSNLIGILKKGLIINPTGVVKTGRMFGSGLYFADVSNKSLSYSHSGTGKDRFLMLFEVVLGNSLNKYQAFSEDLPSKYHSIKGIGNQSPDPTASIYLSNGVEVPLGSLQYNKNPKGQYIILGYNEYVVRNESQARLRYLLHLRSN